MRPGFAGVCVLAAGLLAASAGPELQPPGQTREQMESAGFGR